MTVSFDLVNAAIGKSECRSTARETRLIGRFDTDSKIARPAIMTQEMQMIAAQDANIAASC